MVPIKEEHTIAGSSAKLALIAAVREVLGVGYSTVQPCVGGVEYSEVRTENDLRAAKAAPEAVDK